MDLKFKGLEVLNPRSLKHLSNQLNSLVKERLWLKVIVAMVLGVVVGILMGPSARLVSPKFANILGSWFALPGQIFLALVQMIVVPLVFASIIRGVAASDNIESLKRTGAFASIYFIVTTTLAIVLGISLAYGLSPGSMISPELLKGFSTAVSSSPTSAVSPNIDIVAIPDLIVGVIPKNPLGSMVNLEMLQVVLFSIVIGIALVSLPPKQANPLLDLMDSLQQVCMIVVKWAMKLAPLAVFGLMARIASKVGLNALAGMAAYVGTVVLGLLLLNIGYLLLYAVVTKKSPRNFLKAVREVQLLAFSTSSSAAVMPLSIKTAEEKLGVRPSISQFVIPLGATVNMNGTALYQGVATIFLAQVFGVDLSLGALTLVVITAVASSIGSPATPGVGIVILSMVLETAGIPASGIGLIMGVDRILDMSRTAVNVGGDLVASVILDQLEPNEASQVVDQKTT